MTTDQHRRAPRLTAMRPSTLIATGLVAAAAVAALWWHGDLLALAQRVETEAGAAEAISRAGPFAVVALMALAVVASPIPSGPIAMAAGALYGPWLGGGLTLVGAFAGAMIAFGLSRRFGQRMLGASSRPLAVWITRPRSQSMLMLLVLASRLIPAISFDAVSYVAGLTQLETWRFALATLIGVAPISFAFAAMGAGIMDSGTRPIALAACFVTVLLPAAAFVWRRGRRKRSDAAADPH